MLQAQQFAELAGVTVRTLHHYDRLGLLRARRTEAGYRVYRESDLERLEQIVALKFVGLPLKRIKTLLDRDNLELADALPRQRLVLEAKRKLIDRAIRAIRGRRTHARERPAARRRGFEKNYRGDRNARQFQVGRKSITAKKRWRS
jgi:MerR family transcriptional regulator, thiopeptide resistance regulator